MFIAGGCIAIPTRNILEASEFEHLRIVDIQCWFLCCLHLGVNSSFGRCGLLHCLMMGLCQFILLKSRGSSSEDFSFVTKEVLKEANASMKCSLENETSKPKATSTTAKFKSGQYFWPFWGHFANFCQIFQLYAIESVSLRMGRGVKIGSQNQVMYITGWAEVSYNADSGRATL